MEKREKKKYSQEFKDQVLEVYRSGTYESAAECARAYGIKELTFYQWLNRSAKPAIVKSEEQKEIDRLKRELTKANQELEILKKAAIYFANQAK